MVESEFSRIYEIQNLAEGDSDLHGGLVSRVAGLHCRRRDGQHYRSNGVVAQAYLHSLHCLFYVLPSLILKIAPSVTTLRCRCMATFYVHSWR